jgi:hypothetical protein
LLTGNDSVHVRGEKAELFTGGVCPKCGNPVGKRNKTDVTVEVLPKSSDGGIVWGVGPVYSEQFITLLTVKERDECRFRQVVTATASRRHFFELAGKPVGDWVAACTLGGSGGFGCISCSRRVVYHTIGRTIVRILEKSASLHPTGGVRVAGAAPFNGLVCSLARWDELRGKPGTKNIVAQRIGIAKPDQINDKPAVEIVR